MNIANTLPDSVCLLHDDFEWVQTINYEHVPFHCHKFHEHGHLFRDFPLNHSQKPNLGLENTESYGFTNIISLKWHARKSTSTPKASHPSTNNNFDVFSNQPSEEAPTSSPPEPPLNPANPPLDAHNPQSSLIQPYATSHPQVNQAQSSHENSSNKGKKIRVGLTICHEGRTREL